GKSVGTGPIGRRDAMRSVLRTHRVLAGLGLSLLVASAPGCAKVEPAPDPALAWKAPPRDQTNDGLLPQGGKRSTEDGSTPAGREPPPPGSPAIVVEDLPPRVLARLHPKDPGGGTNLLGLPGVTVERATVTGKERDALAALADGDPNTVAVASAVPEGPLEV